ncbi:remorin 4.1-like [Aristolochia californica]|uniref:remorin 4.1-like n=1 Tax=Aristolochia californica TaxID=171875 RepID=UPI0035DC706A
MLHDQSSSGAGSGDREGEEGLEEDEIRDIHAVTVPPPANRGRRREGWETSSVRSTNLSVGSEGLSDNFTTMSREFNALVLAGSAIENHPRDGSNVGMNLVRIGEDLEETNPLAIVPDNSPLDPVPSPFRAAASSSSSSANTIMEDVSIQRVKKEEVESKISAWQTAKIAKINNRFKREDAILNGWESEEIQKAATWMKKVERKLEERRAKAFEKMQNDVAKARRKAEEKRASAEAKRGTKVARVLEVTNLMRVVGRAPTKRSFF